LVPPLTTVGIGLALGRGTIAGGALLLFITNLIAIAAAGGLVFLMLGFAPPASQKARRNILRRGLTGAIMLLVLVTVILGVLTVQALRAGRLERTVQIAVQDEVRALLPESELVEFTQTIRGDGTLQLAVTVRSSQQYPYFTVLAFQREIATRIQRPVALLLNVIPATRLDPLVPPTFTPTVTLTTTATRGPTAIATATPTATPTATATTTATASPTITASPTATATPTATPTATQTPSTTPTPRPTPGFAVIANTNGLGVLLRTAPGGPVSTSLAEGAPIILTGERVAVNGNVWAQIIAPRGVIGWIAVDYLTTVNAQR